MELRQRGFAIVEVCGSSSDSDVENERTTHRLAVKNIEHSAFSTNRKKSREAATCDGNSRGNDLDFDRCLVFDLQPLRARRAGAAEVIHHARGLSRQSSCARQITG